MYVLLLLSDVPDLDTPVVAAGNKQVLLVEVPLCPVDGHVMCVVGLHEGAGVCRRTEMNVTLLRTNEELIILVLVEVEGSTATCG